MNIISMDNSEDENLRKNAKIIKGKTRAINDIRTKKKKIFLYMKTALQGLWCDKLDFALSFETKWLEIQILKDFIFWVDRHFL